MKKSAINLPKKLFLEKATLAILNRDNQQSVKGGQYYPAPDRNAPPSRAQGYDCCIIATYDGPACITVLNECRITVLEDCIIGLG
ncbi:class I lanthipeptide [Taibaiella chishuiensis]|uniref:Uncharacterized protein n=1 Tax=Taibaiella chishuiensis TaxID=1434707 RepID=A0A2P8D608_9BACT|nr:class I lanthipeptide [Taibaiella chishuiensis]PSK92665.1 hypothetical protein B0I18_103242 [Taibaiella chishuiensis]